MQMVLSHSTLWPTILVVLVAALSLPQATICSMNRSVSVMVLVVMMAHGVD